MNDMKSEKMPELTDLHTGTPYSPYSEVANRYQPRVTPEHCGYPDAYKERFLRDAVAAHRKSFNALLDSFKTTMLVHARPGIIDTGTDQPVSVTLLDITLKPPTITPALARELMQSYQGELFFTFRFKMGKTVEDVSIQGGHYPIMVGSDICLLNGLTRGERIQMREDERDEGGYFIINGQERVVRLHLECASNTPFAFTKYRSVSTQPGYAKAVVHYKSVRADGYAMSTVVHALQDHTLRVRLIHYRKMYFLPLCLVLKALIQTSDKEIHDQIVLCGSRGNQKEDDYISLRVKKMLSDFQEYGLWTRDDCRIYIGQRFRALLEYSNSTLMTDLDCFIELFEISLLVNVSNTDFRSKFDILCYMARKCLLLLGGFITPENPDRLSSQEALTPGALLQAQMTSHIAFAIKAIVRDGSKAARSSSFSLTRGWINTALKNAGLTRLGQFAKSLLTTGTFLCLGDCEYQKMTGIGVIADRLNYVRFLTHFRAIIRSTTASTTTLAIRKLYPDSYGFQCAVHTPDGAPCGLLTHLCYQAGVISETPTTKELDDLLHVIQAYGLVPSITPLFTTPVFFNGVIIGYMPFETYPALLVTELRRRKATGEVFPYTEAFTTCGKDDRMLPGVFVTATRGRFYRSVISLQTETVEYITPLEQQFLHIVLSTNDIQPGLTTHREISPTSMLSIIGMLVPFSDHNQSPRNIYECQMLKQTMGISTRNQAYRYDSKTYSITTPQRPIVKNLCIYDKGGFDTHPTGTNLVVAVLAYTAYDMEDAALVNKASLERGLLHGTIYTVHDIDYVPDTLRKSKKSITDSSTIFTRRDPAYRFVDGDRVDTELDEDGLPAVGAYLETNSTFYHAFDPIKEKYIPVLYKHEPGFVERVCVIHPNQGATTYWSDLQKVSAVIKENGNDESSIGEEGRISRVRIVVRHDRTPVVGDKAASRHGQKGVIGIRWRQSDMPFTSEGIVPDLLINPHAFPSRMTIGMLIESLSSKVGVVNAEPIDSTPFQWDGERCALDVFGEQLLRTKRFNRYGSEVMYSAITGEPMPVDVFIGVVYYQRLRHMIIDKFQVRGTGPYDRITRQPIKGKKKGGGLRFGEMERDAIIAHGAMATFRGRLCTESDEINHVVCEKCGSLLGKALGKKYCRECGMDTIGHLVTIPNVLLILLNDLAAMGVRVYFDVNRFE
ncbi:DNA-directed RNA polymerase subunit B [Giardia muris]|uniref:DNA-directed RNA polymerase subunit beta n=1 Tax=Giardia muris TaxID=5742 RepID=A0A4Z1SX41_GIAMU|nr:DNA-directed RNA polymerase subunit B [Giardia muris]|eukprot:TNJ29405.1 DNA-directed RNA polymerase subunit B [Giardia muris]